MCRPKLVVLVALALALAGCNGFFFSDGASTATVTPVSVPTDDPTPTPEPRLAPGLTRSGVVDAGALAAAQVSTLDDAGFTVHATTTIRFANRIPYRRSALDGRIAADRTRYVLVRNTSGSVYEAPRSVAAWANGSRLVTVERDDGTATDEPRTANGWPDPTDDRSRSALGDYPLDGRAVGALFGAVETRVVDRTRRNGTTLYEVVGARATNRSVFVTRGVTDPRNVSLRAWVTPRGVVREYRLDYTATFTGERLPSAAGGTAHVRRVVRYTHLGDTTPDRPAWVARAVETASRDDGNDSRHRPAGTHGERYSTGRRMGR